MNTPNPQRPFPDGKSGEKESSSLASLWETITRWGLRIPAMRYARHILILLVVAAVAWVARSSILDLLPAKIQIDPSLTARTPTVVLHPTAALPDSNPSGLTSVILRDINFQTYIPDRPRSDVIQYTVAAGDTLFAIAEKFNLKPETLFWANQQTLKDDPDLLTPGMSLNILPVDGVYYQWQEGNRLDVIADKFKSSVVDIVSWPGNNLLPDVDPSKPGIAAGAWLIIPGGSREFIQWQVPILRRTDSMKWSWGGPGACQGPYLSSAKGSGYFIWPTGGHDTSRGNPYADWHHAIDIHLLMGDPIYASDTGVVVFAGWSTWGYGNLIVIDHGNDWQTVYAHLSSVAVGCGFDVNRGQVIGYGGTTGNSTGPHLHFEMMNAGLGYVNPLNYLP
jgi:murein DD-endopeptidase MepM/ murein hydrolase activator NlpD